MTSTQDSLSYGLFTSHGSEALWLIPTAEECMDKGFVLVESMHQDRVYSNVPQQAQNSEKLLVEYLRVS